MKALFSFLLLFFSFVVSGKPARCSLNNKVTITRSEVGSESYLYGYNGKLKDNEWAGLGNHLDFGARGLDTRTGKWQNPDKLADKYLNMSPYVYCVNNPMIFLDPDGNTVHVFISSEPVGTTQIRLVQPSNNSNGAPKTVEIPLYKMTVTNDASSTTSTYLVTRDAPMLNQSDPVDEAWMPWNDDKYNIINTSFEPKQDNATFNLVPLAYPKGMEAFALRNPDGTNVLDAEGNSSPFRKKSDKAEGVMIHVGGIYTGADGKSHITGSEGCFTLSGQDQGNVGIGRFMNDISKRKKQDEAAHKGSDVELKIQKRNNVQTKWQTDKNGNRK